MSEFSDVCRAFCTAVRTMSWRERCVHVFLYTCIAVIVFTPFPLQFYARYLHRCWK